MGFYGADVDELDALADTCVAVAESLRMTRADVRRTVHSSPWDGDDAERFRVDFDRRVGPSLDEVASLLEAAASTIRTNADEQRAASTSTATGGAWGGAPGGLEAWSAQIAHRLPPGWPPMDGFDDLLAIALEHGMFLAELTDAIPSWMGMNTWLGPLASTLAVLGSAQEHGWWSDVTMLELAKGVGGTAAGRFGLLGTVGFYAGGNLAEHVGARLLFDSYFLANYGYTNAEIVEFDAQGVPWATGALREYNTLGFWEQIRFDEPLITTAEDIGRQLWRRFTT